MPTIIYAARSDSGRKRESNEDNLYINGVILTPETRNAPFSLNGAADAPCLFAVCDGMGGEEDGEFASLTAVNTLSEFAERINAAPTEQLDAIVQEYVAKALLCTRSANATSES
jgi:protein phosphatase